MKGNTVASDTAALKNRLQKNQKKLKSLISKQGLEAFRLYHKDIPEYPYLIDVYKDDVVIYEQGKKLDDEVEAIRDVHLEEITKALEEVLKIPPARQHFKTREKQKGKEQYQAMDPKSHDYFSVNEPPFKFWVNLDRYLDTGLFLDHRPLRQFLHQNSSGKKILNLFCYTGSLSVAAAMGGAKVTSVDMSATYLNWALENFKLNDLDPKAHEFQQADVLKYLPEMKERNQKFDIIVLDPPSFSNSKRMDDDLDVERDHPILVRDCMNLLAPGGTLYFSTNKRKFKLHDMVERHYKVKEISQWTIPQDFHHTEIHRSFAITQKENL